MKRFRKLAGAFALICMMGGAVAVVPTEATSPPKVKPSANNFTLDEFSCFDISIEATRFVQNANEYDLFINDINLGFGDVPPDGSFTTSATICGLQPGRYEIRATTTDGQVATSKVKLAAF